MRDRAASSPLVYACSAPTSGARFAVIKFCDCFWAFVEDLTMRLFCLLFLLAFAGGAALLAYENQQDVTLNIFNYSLSTNIPVLVGVTYLAGMLSGWTVIGMLRRSLSRVTQEPLPGEYANTR